GINLRHGYLTEYYVDDAEFVVKIPQGLKQVGVLLEPTTVVEKGIYQAYEIQRRLKVWQPRKAAVLGTGTIGLLATLILRLRGIEVTAFGRAPKPYLNSDLVAALGARYVSTDEMSLRDAAPVYGLFDLIYEATGFCAHRLRGHGSAGQERCVGAGQRHRRQPDGGGAGGKDQPRVRARQQGHGRHGQWQP